jgi:hypothetical protein
MRLMLLVGQLLGQGHLPFYFVKWFVKGLNLRYSEHIQLKTDQQWEQMKFLLDLLLLDLWLLDLWLLDLLLLPPDLLLLDLLLPDLLLPDLLLPDQLLPDQLLPHLWKLMAQLNNKKKFLIRSYS